MTEQQKDSSCRFLTGVFLAEFQQVSVRSLWEGAAFLSAAFQECSSVFICVDGKPNRRLLGAILRLTGGIFRPLHANEDEHS